MQMKQTLNWNLKWVNIVSAVHDTNTNDTTQWPYESRYCIDNEKYNIGNKNKMKEEEITKRPIISSHIESFLTCIYLLFFSDEKYNKMYVFFSTNQQTLNINGTLIPNPYCTMYTDTMIHSVCVCSYSLETK